MVHCQLPVETKALPCLIYPNRLFGERVELPTCYDKTNEAEPRPNEGDFGFNN